jgi:hypothetical protein
VLKGIGRPSPAMVVALIALVAATSGNAIADGVSAVASKVAPKNTVTSRSIVNGTLTLSDFKRSERTKLRGARGLTGLTGPAGPAGPAGPQGPQGVQGPAGTPDGYTKTEADAKFIDTTEKAADANLLDGVDGDNYTTGDADIQFGFFSRNASTAETKLANVGDIGQINVECLAAGSKRVELQNTSGTTLSYTDNSLISGSSNSIVDNTIADGATVTLLSTTSDAQEILQVVRTAASQFASSDAVSLLISAVDNGSTCKFQAHVIHSERDGIGVVLPPIFFP